MTNVTFKHYTVAVHDLDSSVEQYETRFGMSKVGERAYNSIGKFNFQPMGFDGKTMCHLICPDTDGPIAKLMSERVNPFNPHGEGIYLLAYDCDDVPAFAEQVTSNGGRVNGNPASGNIWVHPTASNFVLMEIFPKKAWPSDN